MSEVDHGPRIGADPEVFVQNAEGLAVPICGYIGGTKEAPIILSKEIKAQWGETRYDKGCVGDYAVQEDNVMLEFNIPAFSNYSGFVAGIDRSIRYIQDALLTPKNLTFRFGNSIQTFDQEVLDKSPQSKTVGCLPDLDAYAEGGKLERKPFTSTDLGTMRFCGGHIHVQYNKNNVPPPVFARFMDLVCLQYLNWDKQKQRRKFYGQPGIFRDKPYGIEYRTLSNFWLKTDFRQERLMNLADSILRLANTANTDSNRLKAIYPKVEWQEIRRAITTEDHRLGNELVSFCAGLGFNF
jgi:Phage phiEco32-like COOH.NH2 ligase-type 2